MTSLSSIAPSSPLSDIQVPVEYGPLRTSLLRRIMRVRELAYHPGGQAIEMEICRRDDQHWFDWWAWTYNPKEVGTGPAHLPFDLFPRQREMLVWTKDRLAAREDGLVEKSRDVGFTWEYGGIAIHRWLFVDGFKTTFGSRKVEYVDRIGDPDSIFEKMRMLVRALPRWMLPRGFDPVRHDNHLLLFNPVNGNTIRGEGGDEMGRGGRSTLYIVDEAAFLERAERVDAATTANTDCRIWGSSANGTGNLFYSKRFGGTLRPEQIFRLHWRDDPRKTEEWAAAKRATTEAWIWASEYDIDYTASVEGICIPAKWVEAAKIIRPLLAEHGMRMEPAVRGEAGGDVGAGKARSVVVPRFGPVVHVPTSWREPDTTETAHRMVDACQSAGDKRGDSWDCRIATLRFDSVGVGAGVESTLKKSRGHNFVCVPVNVGQPPSGKRWPDGETSAEKFANMKAEAWWLMRDRLKSTYEMVLHLRGEEGGVRHNPDDCLALPPDTMGPEAMALSSQLSVVKWERNEKGKIIIEPKKHLAQRGVASPDYADALALTFCAPSGAESLRRAYGSVAA